MPAFYELLVAAVRAVDAKTPIMLDGGFYAAADSYEYWPGPLQDERVLYAYHMYEPWAATSSANVKRKEPYRYPGVAPSGGTDTEWNSARVEAYLQQPVDWAKKHGVPVSRLVAGEFGCVRTWPDCPRYLEDVLTALEGDGVHWAFYAFREDVWDAMDYELGSGKVPWQYWEAQEKGRPFVLRAGLTKSSTPSCGGCAAERRGNGAQPARQSSASARRRRPDCGPVYGLSRSHT